MSRWRPVDLDAIYVLPDLHGNLDLLKKVCDRILPLRKSDGGRDTLVLLGDYIDRHPDSHLVIDFCIDLKKTFGDQVVCLMGNHELMLLESLGLRQDKKLTLQEMSHIYKLWMENGGYDTILGYMKRAGQTEGWGSIARQRALDFIPGQHIEFFQNLLPYHEIEDYVFVHGGLNPQIPPEDQLLDTLVWDRSLVKFVRNRIDNDQPLPWEKIVVCGHSPLIGLKPLVHKNYFMLDCGAPKQLLVAEMRSQTAFMAHPDKDRLVKFELSETEKCEKKPGAARRVQ